MCGIFFSSSIPEGRPGYLRTVGRFIRHRGIYEPRFHLAQGMLLAHCLMPVQGESPVEQPVVSNGNVLLFSGELWDHGSRRSDTRYLFDVLSESTEVASTITELRGMFALVYFSTKLGRVYFASDVFGEIPLYFTYVDRHLSVASEIKRVWPK